MVKAESEHKHRIEQPKKAQDEEDQVIKSKIIKDMGTHISSELKQLENDDKLSNQRLERKIEGLTQKVKMGEVEDSSQATELQTLSSSFSAFKTKVNDLFSVQEEQLND